MHFDMNAAWQRALSLVGKNFQLLSIIAGVFLLIPSLVVYMAAPEFAMLSTPGGDPEQMAERVQSMLPAIMGWSAVLMVFSLIGYMALIALMGASRPTVGEALKRSLKSFPTVLGATVLFFLIYVLIMLVGVLIAGAITALTGIAALAVLMFIVMLFVVAIVMIRFVLTMPIIILDPQSNPITAMKKSWTLTGPRKWAIFGFWMLLFVAYLVIAVLVMGVVGMLGALASTSSGSLLMLGLLNGIMGALIAMLASGILVAMYEQLVSGNSPEAVSETFD